MAGSEDTGRTTVESRRRKKNITLYLLLFFGTLVYAYLYGGIFPYSLLYLMLALPVISALHLLTVCSLFRFGEQLNEKAFVKGECASYRLTLHNPSFMYMPDITVRMRMEGQFILKSLKSMRISLAPFSRREFKYDMPLLFRGRYDIGVKDIVIQDLLGIISYRINPREKKNILVKPRILEMPYKHVPAGKVSEGDVSTGLHDMGNDEILDIREYAYGDSFRKIHWKVSSKLSKTMVKETRNELDNDVLAILNLQRSGELNEDALLREDCVIEELLSSAYYLLRRNMAVRLCFLEDTPYTFRATSINEFESLHQILSEVKFNQDNNFNNVIDYFTDMEETGKLVYIFSVVLDADIVSKAHDVINKGFDVELYYMGVSGMAEDDAKAGRDLAEALMKSNIKAYMLEPRAVLTKGGKEEIDRNGVNAEAEAESV